MGTKYQPTEVDLNWAKNVLRCLTDGGIIAYPATQVIYKVDKVAKTLTLQNPEQLTASFASYVIHQQTIDVFAELGYRVAETD
jgi:hypothetical protein